MIHSSSILSPVAVPRVTRCCRSTRSDGGTRRFIAVEMDEAICREVTAQRLKLAIVGYKDKE